MLVAIKLIGGLLCIIGFMALLFPKVMKKRLHFFFEDRWLSLVSGFRILFGFFLIWAAPMSNHPLWLFVAGLIIIAIGFGVPLLTRKQLIKTEIWWLERKRMHVRLLSFIPIGIGSVLIFAASW